MLIASSGVMHKFDKVSDMIETRYPVSRYNIYMFYASDGENFEHDRDKASTSLSAISEVANYMGFVQTVTVGSARQDTEMANLFNRLEQDDAAAGTYFLREETDVWDAIKAFFQQQASEAA